MPLFRYKAQDAQGRDVEGSVSANDVTSAQQVITRRGLRLFGISEASTPGFSANQTARPQPAPAVQPAVRPSPVVVPQPVAPARPRQTYEPARRDAGASVQPISQHAQHINMPLDQPLDVRRTKRGSYKSVGFIFGQLTSYFKAGINPGQALETLAQQQPNQLYRESLMEAAKATQEGSRFSRILERYPDLYRPHMAGMIRAGEVGGYLPEAANAVAEQAASARKIGMALNILSWWIVVHLFMLVPAWLLIKFSMDQMDAQFASGGTANTGQVFLHSVGNQLLWPTGPLMLGILAAMLWYNHWMMDSRRSLWRDRMALKVPNIGKRARNESLAIFSWTLGMVSRAGVPPKTAFDLAIGAMPNLWMQKQLRDVESRMQDGTRLSEAVASTNLLPPDYAAIIQTGEMTGDLATSMHQISGAANDDFQREDKLALARVVVWGVTVMIITSGVAAWFIAHDFYPHLIQTASSGD